jgi:hypothetical protein
MKRSSSQFLLPWVKLAQVEMRKGCSRSVAGMERYFPVETYVVVGDVGDNTANSTGRAGGFVDLGVEFGSRTNVRIPPGTNVRTQKLLRGVLNLPKPTSVATVEVHVDIGQVERLEGIDGKGLVVGCSTSALGYVHVCDHVGKSCRRSVHDANVFNTGRLQSGSMARLILMSGYFLMMAAILSMYSILN